jgi:hypothetical protein
VVHATAIAVALKNPGPAFLISGVTHAGTSDLTEAVMRFLESGEAPAQGNLPLPVIHMPKAKVVTAAKKKPAAKKRATAPRKKAAPKKRSAKRAPTRTTRKAVKPAPRKKTRPQKSRR